MDVIALIEKAIQNEKEAAAMYREGADLATDPETRTMFEHLIKWERDHERLLEDRLETLRLLREQE